MCTLDDVVDDLGGHMHLHLGASLKNAPPTLADTRRKGLSLSEESRKRMQRLRLSPYNARED